MADIELKKISPGFCSDRDEEWLIYLPSEKQTYLKTKRMEYIRMTDDLSTIITEWKRKKVDNKHKLTKEQKRQVDLDYKRKQKSLEQKLNSLINDILPKIKTLKAEALETKRKDIEQDSESLRKRRRTCQDDAVDIEDVEFVEDDYLPSYMPSNRESCSRSTSKTVRDNTPMDFTNLKTSPSKSANSIKQADLYLKDVKPKDAKILTELRPLIEKYNCRDRVVKVIDAIRTRDTTLGFFNTLDKILAKK